MDILIADDHHLYIQGIRMMLQEYPVVEQVYEAKDLASVLRSLQQNRVDLLLLDLRMPDMEGFDGVYRIIHDFPDLSVVLVTSSESRVDIRTARNAGCHGYILKSLSHREMSEALQNVLSGNDCFPDMNETEGSPIDQLTQRQLEVLHLVNDGMGNREIAAHLQVAEGTISQHIHNILRNLQVKSRTEAARILRQYE